MALITSTTISWRSGEDTHYENAGSEESHQLKLNYSVTGPLEIGVHFLGSTCTKSSAISYNGKKVNFSYLSYQLHFISVERVLSRASFISTNTTLIVQSRDCIDSPENYTLVVTFTNNLTESLNVSFNAFIVCDVGDVIKLMADTVYIISVVLVETTSDTVIDEMNMTIKTLPEPGS